MKVQQFAGPQREYTQARRFVRKPAQFPVAFRAADGSAVPGHVKLVDLSVGGLGLSSDETPEPMSLLELVVDLPQIGPSSVLARVMWVKGERFGLRFERVEREVLDSIERLT